MANVAGQRLYKGMGHMELKEVGLFLGISNIEKLRRQVDQVVSQHEESLNYEFNREPSRFVHNPNLSNDA